MAADGINFGEDAEMAECDGDKVVTMMDVLQEQQDFEEDANAVLGASDDKNCTYPKGYIKRQALYACLTCCTEAKTDPTKRAGVCLACSLMCHENHELIELYTKRNFRCDCGNPKFNSHPCQFTSDKTDLNDENIYNQNFSGLYCTCQRPYPDPDNTTDDDMIQCIICEDWLHASHLDATVPTSDYSEMICKACMEKNEFLHDYSRFAVNSENGDGDIITVNGLCNEDTEKEVLVNGVIEKIETEAANVNGDVEMNEKNEKSEDKTEAHTEHDEISTADNIEVTKQELENKKTKDKDLSIDTVETLAKEETNGSEATSKQNETTSDDQIKIDTKIDHKMDDTNSESDKVEESSTEQSESLEQNTEQAEEKGGGDIVPDNEKSEHKLLDDLSALTEDIPAPTEEVKEPISDAMAAENVEKSDDTKESLDSINTNELPKETSNENGESNEDKPDDTSETTGHLEVPDTSQAEQTENRNTADSVMDAIDELLESAEKSQDSKIPKKQESSVLAESKDSSEETNNIDNKVDEVPEKATEELTNKNNTDIEMSDASKQDEILTNEIKPNKPSTNSESKSENVQESSDSTSEALVEENHGDNESRKKIDGDPKVPDTIEESTNENNVNDDELHKMTESTNKNELSLDDNKAPSTENTTEHKRKLSTDFTDDTSSKKAKLECVRPKGVKRIYKGATFWPSNFRQKLCTCGECITMYNDLKVLFLTDPEDTVYAYESLGKENVAGRVSQYEKGLQALSSLDHIQQINALTEYNNMKDKLLDFLKSFKDRKEVVKEEDIRAFFAGMKPRREPDGVYFCR